MENENILFPIIANNIKITVVCYAKFRNYWVTKYLSLLSFCDS